VATAKADTALLTQMGNHTGVVVAAVFSTDRRIHCQHGGTAVLMGLAHLHGWLAIVHIRCASRIDCLAAVLLP
jgi:hypothetical protein